ncbi:MAG TPA: sigma-70 family RNA polymerase sigma factor [Polyangiaceae bacterium]|jgi:RNA polymerase sigma-70 factor (ECF subfamily)
MASRPETQPRPSGPSDAALVVAARAGEDWAREALFRRYSRMVFALAYRLIGRDHEIDDLVQDCFTQALASLHRLAEPQAFGGWLTAIVVRTTRKMLRRRAVASRLGLGRRQEPIDPDMIVSRSAPADVQMELRAVYGILDGMPPRMRIALVLRRVEGASQDEVAQYLGVSISTAKRLIIEADLRLEAALADPKTRSRP